jgi:hypothetical protein
MDDDPGYSEIFYVVRPDSSDAGTELKDLYAALGKQTMGFHQPRTEAGARPKSEASRAASAILALNSLQPGPPPPKESSGGLATPRAAPKKEPRCASPAQPKPVAKRYAVEHGAIYFDGANQYVGVPKEYDKNPGLTFDGAKELVKNGQAVQVTGSHTEQGDVLCSLTVTGECKP